MLTIHQTVEVPYPPQAMYALVNDVASYPKFVPFCKAGKKVILVENKREEATLTFSWMGISDSFSTRNILQHPYRIKMQLIKGPLKYLEGQWEFMPTPSNGTIVALSLQFKWSNQFFDGILRPIFTTMVYQAVGSFKKQADKCYG